MIATALLVSNLNEIIERKNRVEKLGLGEPEIKPILIEREFCFPLSAVLFCFLIDDGNIKILLNGQEITLKYNKEVHDRLREHFKNI
jgi:hypothetical protein